MLIRLLPEQASRNWEEIKIGIEQSLPPIVGMQSDRMSNILRSIMLEEVTVWISANSENKSDGIVLTTFVFDKLSGTKSLLIYCIYGYGNSDRSSWEDGFETIKKFAVANRCNRLIGYTDVPSLIKFAETIGGQANYRLVSLPLEITNEKNIH